MSEICNEQINTYEIYKGMDLFHNPDFGDNDEVTNNIHGFHLCIDAAEEGLLKFTENF